MSEAGRPAARCSVDAGALHSSSKRLAARPVGAASATERPARSAKATRAATVRLFAGARPSGEHTHAGPQRVLDGRALRFIQVEGIAWTHRPRSAVPRPAAGRSPVRCRLQLGRIELARAPPDHRVRLELRTHVPRRRRLPHQAHRQRTEAGPPRCRPAGSRYVRRGRHAREGSPRGRAPDVDRRG